MTSWIWYARVRSGRVRGQASVGPALGSRLARLGRWTRWGGAWLGFWVVGAVGAEINVLAAASLSDALVEVGKSYARTSPDSARFSFGSSSALARQIKEGVPADLFISADEAKMDDVSGADLVLEGSRRALLGNTLVVIVHAERGADVRRPEDLASPGVRRLALGEVSSVPAGIYARKFLEASRLWDQVRHKVVGTDNVRATLAAVESGNADAGIVYRTDALQSKLVRVVWTVTGPLAPDIVYPVAVLRTAADAGAARRFAAFLDSEAAWQVWRRFGFIPPVRPPR
jgi:molybdate transport system substrate-binding protein